MANLKANIKIKQAMRKREKWVLDYFRKNPTAGTSGWFSIPTYNALDRLEKAGMIRYRRATRTRCGAHIVRKYARPVS
jgi:hypothetical protein